MSRNHKQRKRYTAEFKSQAVKLLGTGPPVARYSTKSDA